MLRNSLFYMSLFLAVLMPLSARAQDKEDVCRWNGNLSVNVIYELPRTQSDLSHQDIKDLRRVDSRYLPQFEEGWPALIRYRPTLGVAVLAEKKTRANGETCWQIGAANIYHGYKDVNIHIATELPEGSCGFEALRQHQIKHVKEHKAFLHNMEPQLRQEAEKVLSAPLKLKATSVAEAQREVDKLLVQVVKKVWDQESETNRKRQETIDNPAEIALIKDACGGVIAKQIKK